MLGSTDIEHFRHCREFYWTDLIQDLKLVPVWGSKPPKTCYGHLHLSLLSDTLHTATQVTELCLPPRLSTKIHNTTNQKWLEQLKISNNQDKRKTNMKILIHSLSKWHAVSFMNLCSKSGQCHFWVPPCHLFLSTTTFFKKQGYFYISSETLLNLFSDKASIPIPGHKFLPENSNYRGIIKKAQEMGNLAKKRFMCKPRQSDIKALLIFLWISTD